MSDPLTHLRGTDGRTLCGKDSSYGSDSEGNVNENEYVTCPRCLAIIYAPTMMKRDAA